MSNALAVSAVTVTVDGHVVTHLRSEAVGNYVNMRHVVPSGHPHPPQTLTEAIGAELEDELGAQVPEVLGQMIATGLIVNKENGKPELTFLLHLDSSYQQILSRSPVDSWEYRRLESLEWTPQSVEAWLCRYRKDSVPPGHAALLLAGRAEFGETWMRQTIAAFD